MFTCSIIATSDQAANARNASIAAISELLKLCASHAARQAFDQCEGAEDPFLQGKMDSAMASMRAKMEKNSIESQSGDWLEGISRLSMDRDLFLSKIDTAHEMLIDPQSDSEERVKALRLIRSSLHSNPEFLTDGFWQELAPLPPQLASILKTRKLTKLVREASLTIQHLCSIRNSPNSVLDEPMPHLFGLLHRIGDSNSAGADAVWSALKMATRKYQHSKVIKNALKANPATNPALKEINVPSVRRRVMNLLELMLTLWEDARPLRKCKAGIIEAIHRGIYDSDGETRQCARRAWHGLHAHFPSEAAELLRQLTTAQQNLILGKVAESRAPSRGGSRANSPGRGTRKTRPPAQKVAASQPVSRSGSPGRSRRLGSCSKPGGNTSSSRIPSARSTRHSREGSPSRKRVARPVNGTRTTVSSRRGSPSRMGSGAGRSSKGSTPQGDKTVPVIKALTSISLSEKKAGLLGLKRLIEKQVKVSKNKVKSKGVS